jgi:hypothetical protein
VTSKGDIVLWGNKLDFRNTTGGTDTDRMEISRFSSVADATDLRVVIGDNIGGDDRLVVGPIHYADGLFKEQFIVENNGDARIARDLYVGGRKALIDVMSGEVVLNRTTNGSGTYTFNLVSRLPRISGAQLMVALSDIGNNNVANDARWRVQTSGISVVGTNSANFSVAWRVDDSDGWLIAFSYVAIFLP